MVLHGGAAEYIAGYAQSMGEPLGCRVTEHVEGDHCGRVAMMEVYGLAMCPEHGEEAAASALEEIANDLEDELGQPVNPYVRPLSPHLAHALRGAGRSLPAEAYDYRRAEAALLAAFPLRRDLADAETVAYAADPEAAREDPREPPYEAFEWDRRLVCRHMRLAFEERATWLVEVLEKLREETAAQAAYALALEREAGLRPPLREG